MIQALIAQEDARFFRHSGFAPAEIRVALAKNLQAGRFLQGASTISMQLAKNLFLQRRKTLDRKIQEAFFTWWLEESLSKNEILELYLNIVEFGPALYGIGPASRHYFGREPYDLSPAEAVFLSTLLPNPKEYAKIREAGTLSSSRKRRLENRLQHMFEKGRIDRVALKYGIDELKDFHFYQQTQSPPEPHPFMGYAKPLPSDPPETIEVWEQRNAPEASKDSPAQNISSSENSKAKNTAPAASPSQVRP